jgi:Protein of unknown function (DUF2750)
VSKLRADGSIAVRDRFVERVAAAKTAFAVSGEEGLARVPSQIRANRHVTLFWSDLAEVKRWATAIAKGPRIKQLTIRDLLADILPKLGELNRLTGPDWTADPVEPEVEAAELIRQLRRAMVDHFVAQSLRQGHVYVLAGVDGPHRFMSRNTQGTFLLPVWAEQASAEARIDGPYIDAFAARIPLEDFRRRTLMWAAETKTRIAPAFCEGPGAIELEVWDVKARLKSADATGSASAA